MPDVYAVNLRGLGLIVLGSFVLAAAFNLGYFLGLGPDFLAVLSLADLANGAILAMPVILVAAGFYGWAWFRARDRRDRPGKQEGGDAKVDVRPVAVLRTALAWAVHSRLSFFLLGAGTVVLIILVYGLFPKLWVLLPALGIALLTWLAGRWLLSRAKPARGPGGAILRLGFDVAVVAAMVGFAGALAAERDVAAARAQENRPWVSFSLDGGANEFTTILLRSVQRGVMVFGPEHEDVRFYSWSQVATLRNQPERTAHLAQVRPRPRPEEDRTTPERRRERRGWDWRR